MNHVLAVLLFVTSASAFAKPIYKVDKAIKAADHIVLGEIYKVDMVDRSGNLITELRTHATRENGYKIRNHIRIVESVYGGGITGKEFLIERPLSSYYGKEALREGLRLFYFLKKDGSPIEGKYEFSKDRRPRIMEFLKTKG